MDEFEMGLLMYLPYTGIGSRDAPKMHRLWATQIAHLLEVKGFTLRSGGAEGMDISFEEGVSSPAMKEIYLPWPRFNANRTPHPTDILAEELPQYKKSLEYVQRIHPAPEKLGRGARALHGRNPFQVLGRDLQTPSQFVICSAPPKKDGLVGGGTRTAIALAVAFKIPFYNLQIEEHRKDLEELLLVK